MVEEEEAPPQEKPDRVQPWDVGQGFTPPLPPRPSCLSPFVFTPSIPYLSYDLEYLSAETSFRDIYSYNCEKYLLQIYLN